MHVEETQAFILRNIRPTLEKRIPRIFAQVTTYGVIELLQLFTHLIKYYVFPEIWIVKSLLYKQKVERISSSKVHEELPKHPCGIKLNEWNSFDIKDA